jgi:hypothetical protein
MTNPYKELFTKKKVQAIEVSGYMECLYCYEGVTSGLYNPEDKSLTYTCSKEHTSIIPEYSL